MHNDTPITGTTSRNDGHTHTYTMTHSGQGQTAPGGADAHTHVINEGKALWWNDHMHSIVGPDRQGA